MSEADGLQYMIQGNPVSRRLINTSMDILMAFGLRPKKMKDAPPAVTVQAPLPERCDSLHSLIGNHSIFIRIAGLGGASAIFMGAYCRYQLRVIRDPKEQQEAQAFADVANRIHFLHSFAMLCMPMAHFPVLSGTIMTIGTVLFSGSMYYRALSGNRSFNYFATIGGFCLIGSWLSLTL